MARIKRIKRCSFLLIAALLISVSAAGHPESVSYGSFSIGDDGVAAVYRLPMDDMDLLLMLDEDLDGSVSNAELQLASGSIEDYLRKHTTLAASSELELRLDNLDSWLDQDGFPYLEARVSYEQNAPIESLRAKVTVLTDLYPGHRTLAEFTTGNVTNQFVFQGGNFWLAGEIEKGANQSASGFVLMGIEHIATGYDHLLFLLGLLLVGRGLRDLVTIVTAFTIGHSITLALAVLQIMNPGAVLVESAIALSIVYVGAENIIAKNVRHRWFLALVFGFVHGFGFASILRDLVGSENAIGWSLFSFNIGVELGQIAIVAVALPPLLLLKKASRHLLIVRIVSTAIVAFGLYWFIERIS